MTRNRKNRPRRNNGDPIECIPFRFFSFSSGIANGTMGTPVVATIDVSPAFEPRLSGIAEYYQWYRFKSFSVTIFPVQTGGNGGMNISVGYLPRPPNTAPTTHYDVQTMPASTYIANGHTKEAKMNVPAKIALGDAPLKWFQSLPGTEDQEFEIQGIIYFAATNMTGATSNPYTYRIDGICEFKGRSATGQTPLFLKPNPIPLHQMTESDSSRSWADRMIEADREKDKSQNDSDATVTIGGYVYKRV